MAELLVQVLGELLHVAVRDGLGADVGHLARHGPEVEEEADEAVGPAGELDAVQHVGHDVAQDVRGALLVPELPPVELQAVLRHQ